MQWIHCFFVSSRLSFRSMSLYLNSTDHREKFPRECITQLCNFLWNFIHSLLLSQDSFLWHERQFSCCFSRENSVFFIASFHERISISLILHDDDDVTLMSRICYNIQCLSSDCRVSFKWDTDFISWLSLSFVFSDSWVSIEVPEENWFSNTNDSQRVNLSSRFWRWSFKVSSLSLPKSLTVICCHAMTLTSLCFCKLSNGEEGRRLPISCWTSYSVSSPSKAFLVLKMLFSICSLLNSFSCLSWWSTRNEQRTSWEEGKREELKQSCQPRWLVMNFRCLPRRILLNEMPSISFLAVCVFASTDDDPAFESVQPIFDSSLTSVSTAPRRVLRPKWREREIFKDR